jgi:hypothetical protein
MKGDGASTANFDVLKNGTSIYPTSAKPSVSAGSYIGVTRVPDTTTFSEGDYFQVDVTSTGGTLGALIMDIKFNA